MWAPIRPTIPRTRPPPLLAAISTSPVHNLQLCPGHCFIEPRKPQARKHLVQLAPSRVAQTPRLHQNSPLDSKYARRGELSWALSQAQLSSIEPLFPHVERTSVKLCRNAAQRSAAQRPPAYGVRHGLSSSRSIWHPRLESDDTVQHQLVSPLTARFWSLRLAVRRLDVPLSAPVHNQDVLARSRAPSQRTHTREYARDLS